MAKKHQPGVILDWCFFYGRIVSLGQTRTNVNPEIYITGVGVRLAPLEWSAITEIRTQRGFNIREGNCVCPVFVVVGEYDFIVKQPDRVYKDVNDLPLVVHAVHIAVFELTDPAYHFIFRVSWA